MSIQASVPPPGGFQAKGGFRQRAEKERRYGTPLPLLLPDSPLHVGYRPAASASSSSSSSSSSFKPNSNYTCPQSSLLAAYRGIISPAAAVAVPNCHGTLDRASQSVWVEGEAMETLFNRGFFGKGTLSRSDPNWRSRRVELLKGGSALAAEQIREKRRKERKQFKIDRAAAMLDAAKKAEAVLTTGVLPQGVEFVADGPVAVVSSSAGAAGEDALAVVEEDVSVTEVSEIATPAEEVSRSASPAPSAATAADFTALLPEGTKLTAQTFLVRPTRPDANRNRGKKPFKRRPAGPAGPGAAAAAATTASASPSTPTPAPAARIPTPAPAAEEEDSSDSDDELVAEMEHLQLSYQEAWFLSSLGVLKVFDPEVASYIPPTALLQHLLTPISPPAPSPALVPARATALYPDDPLLVSYAAYHHYRSLGWCVRDGIKFCVDWLLYRRGPVFSHSVFSILTVPVYMDAADQAKSPYGVTDWYADRMSWKWMNTVMRVNSLVMKTIIIAYITIPSIDSFPASARLPGGGLDPRKFSMREIMGRYTVREVSLMRFGPARRRD